MATRPSSDPQRNALFDLPQIEEAGQALRKWVDRLLGHVDDDDTGLIWESGELRDDERDPPRSN